MSPITFNTAPRVATGAPNPHNLFSRLSQALDAFVMSRTQRAVPESELRRADREIKRYRRLAARRTS